MGNTEFCLYIHSGLRSWSQANSNCKLFHGDLLYIDDQNEERLISSYLNSIKEFWYKNAPLIFLDIRKDKNGYIWSRNNKTVYLNLNSFICTLKCI